MRWLIAGQRVSFKLPEKTYLGTISYITKTRDPSNFRVEITWDGDNTACVHYTEDKGLFDNLTPLSQLSESNPNRTFLENKYKCTVINTSKAKK